MHPNFHIQAGMCGLAIAARPDSSRCLVDLCLKVDIEQNIDHFFSVQPNYEYSWPFFSVGEDVPGVFVVET